MSITVPEIHPGPATMLLTLVITFSFSDFPEANGWKRAKITGKSSGPEVVRPFKNES